MLLRGSTVTLTERTESGTNDFGESVWTETEIPVEGVLIGRPSAEDISAGLELYGKRAAYTLGIPKGDTHNWVDATVQFFGHTFLTFGLPLTAEPDNIPLCWGQIVHVAAVE